jgi:hypothetical protein
MESVGSEKRIQALYSELRLENQSRGPQFDRLWTRAQVSETTAVRTFGAPLAVLIAFSVAVVACSFAVWAWYRSTGAPTPNIVLHQPEPEPAIEESLAPASSPSKTPPRRPRNIVRRRESARWNTTAIAMLSSWQSPTQRFMESPTDLVPTSLPQLNQSVKDLESFLSQDNEITKESNR